MRYEFRVGINFMTHNKGQSIFIISAIALGVAVQIFISSLIVSLQGSLIDRILGDSAHIYIDDGNIRDKLLLVEDNPIFYGNFPVTRNKIDGFQEIINYLSNFKEISVIVPTLEGNAIYSRSGKTTPLNIRGLDLNNGDRLYNITSRVILGDSTINSENVLIGTRLAKNYELQIGDIMPLTLPTGKIESVRIAGIFDMENPSSNGNLVIMDLNKAQRIFNKKGDITHINIQIQNVFDAPNLAELFQKKYPDLEVVPWTRDGENILKALKAQTASSFVIQVVVMLATSMSIASVLLVTVLQKMKEIGILKAMGALDKSTGYFFIIQGALIGFLGSILGLFFGLGIIELYVTTTQPSFNINIEPKKLALIIFVSTLSGIISGIVPARKCMRLSPIEVIKGE
ncbi:ABC transporter permease [Candidatus Cetobacterium colombiensis]|uniref:FtsX-like permease family protein n=1 Tax=Candidatus Cetobacterium colombiensis TaxID=3073100 RepID=A0ABU4WDE7_9FUSO|nr:FtsX-like permease family protein [Candidatus Cetobacterium colombiensis]MDX8336606.1 FtsX-like permease family protein [Candidatus Cetobacterium colombiensis]